MAGKSGPRAATNGSKGKPVGLAKATCKFESKEYSDGSHLKMDTVDGPIWHVCKNGSWVPDHSKE